jgi:hypothetical protein
MQGVGYPLDIVVCSAFGADMYDCVYPTRTARFETALVPEVGILFNGTHCALGSILTFLPHFLSKFSFCYSSPLASVLCLLCLFLY